MLRGDKNLEQFSTEYDSLLKAVRKSHGEETSCADMEHIRKQLLML